ncbi:uncharacterized protein LOC120191073 isoform X2 [Hibiscus syriacus]|uniref:uncharacterized protein LOC120191073 isoform X2 n=1 Tax=Hibiscus syriacus TaxID=106335 RepID=UPI0019228B84|nr:uncharacterized protein LOC120191073 isoform X2 [Hibiscus syriacus]
MIAVAGREYSDVMLARQVERGLNIKDGVQVSRKALPDYETSHFPNYSEVKENKSVTYSEGTQSIRADGKFGSSKSPVDVSERPKLKLLPRTKPLDNLESSVVDAKQQWSIDSVIGHGGIGNDSYGHVNTSKPGSAGSENGNQTVERPKLNFKPCSQPLKN